MRADEKVLNRGDVVGEAGHRHFQIFRPNGADNHVTLFRVGSAQGAGSGGCQKK